MVGAYHTVLYDSPYLICISVSPKRYCAPKLYFALLLWLRFPMASLARPNLLLSLSRSPFSALHGILVALAWSLTGCLSSYYCKLFLDVSQYLYITHIHNLSHDVARTHTNWCLCTMDPEKETSKHRIFRLWPCPLNKKKTKWVATGRLFLLSEHKSHAKPAEAARKWPQRCNEPHVDGLERKDAKFFEKFFV